MATVPFRRQSRFLSPQLSVPGFQSRGVILRPVSGRNGVPGERVFVPGVGRIPAMLQDPMLPEVSPIRGRDLVGGRGRT